MCRLPLRLLFVSCEDVLSRHVPVIIGFIIVIFWVCGVLVIIVPVGVVIVSRVNFHSIVVMFSLVLPVKAWMCCWVEFVEIGGVGGDLPCVKMCIG